MTICQKVAWAMVFLAACTSSMDFDHIERSINQCVDELAANESVNTEGGRLIGAWSRAHVVQYSTGQVLHIFFKHAEPSSLPTQDKIDDRMGIMCNLDGAGTVIALVSPERRNNRLVVREFVLDDLMIEDAAFEKIADTLRNDEAVYRFESYYSLSGKHVEPVGNVTKEKVLPQDFGVE